MLPGLPVTLAHSRELIPLVEGKKYCIEAEDNPTCDMCLWGIYVYLVTAR
jgi:hypothetical protein